MPLFPLWLLVATIAIVLPLAAFLGWRSGRSQRLLRGYDKTPPSSYPGEASLGAMLAMLGLLLAFTFGFALSKSETRKAAQLEEAMAISTAFLRADVLPDPRGRTLQEALLAYAATRVSDKSLSTKEGLRVFLERSLEMQAVLWPTMRGALGEDTPAAIVALLVNGITDVLDAHTRRMVAGTDYIPTVAKVMLLAVAAASLFFVGNNAGLRGRDLTWRTFIFASALAIVMIVILDFERAQEGLIRLDTRVMEETVKELQAALGVGQTTE